MFDKFSSFGKKLEEESLVEAILSFWHAVNWREPFIICLLCFHACVFATAWVTRRHANVSSTIFLVVLLLVLCAKSLNTAAAARWEHISTQNYFDRNGIFASVLFSGPLLLLGMFLLLNMILESSRLLVKVKQAELRAHARTKRNRKQD